MSKLSYIMMKNSHWPLTILMGFTSLMNLFLPLVLVRLLSAEDVGFYKIFFLYVVTAPWVLLAAGFGNGIYFWAGQNEERKHALNATFSFQLIWSLGVLTVGVLAYALIFQNIQTDFILLKNPEYLFFILGVALLIPSQFLEDVQVAHGKTRWAGFYGAFWEVLKSAAMLLSVFWFHSVHALVLAFLLVMFLKFITSTILTLRLGYAKFSLFSNPQRAAVLRYALPSSGAAMLSVILSYCDQFILGQKLPPAEFMLYSLGCLSIPPLLIFEQSVNKVLIPKLSATFHKATSILVPIKIFRQSITDLSLWMIPSVAGLFFFAKPLTELLFTQRYPETADYLKIYCFYYLFFSIPYDAVARARGASAWILKSIGIFSVVSLIGTFIGAYTFGAKGALVLFLFSQGALRVYALFSIRRTLRVGLQQMLPLRAWLHFASTAVILGYVTSKCILFFPSQTSGLFVMGILFWIIYILQCVPWTMTFERRERASRKVLMLTQYLNVGGLERMVLNLSNTLKMRGHWQPSVFVYDALPKATVIDSEFSHQQIPVTRFHKKEGFSWRLPWILVKETHQQDIDMIHAHDIGPLIYASFAKLLSFGRIRVIYTQHSFVHLKKGKKYSIYEKVFARLADEIITVSENLKNTYIQLGIRAEHVKTIENGIPFSNPLTNEGERMRLRKTLMPHLPQEKQFWILNLARLHPGKGQDHVLKIWAQLPTDIRSKCALLFVGSETYPDYQKSLQSDHTPGVYFLGSSLQPAHWLQCSDLLISASEQEGLPLSPLEAIAIGMPVFLSRIPGHALLGDVATYFELSNPAEAAQQLANLVTHPQAFVMPEAIRQRFSIDRMTEEYENIYQE